MASQVKVTFSTGANARCMRRNNISPLRSLGILVVAIFVLATTPIPALAQRIVWEHKGGFFKNRDGNHWVEKSKDRTFNFKETTRCTDYIELEDRSRGTTVRLHADAMHLKGGDFKDFTPYYKGRWSIGNAPADAKAKPEQLFRTKHYELYVEGPDADDFAALLEAAYPIWKAHFGLEPKARLKVNVYTDPARYCLANGVDKFSGRNQDYTPRGWYLPGKSASFVMRAQRPDWAYWARVVLLHECVHQFHDKVSQNLKLQIGAIHPLSMRTGVERALENFKSGKVDLLKVVSGETIPVNGDYALWRAILAYAHEKHPKELTDFTRAINRPKAGPVAA